MSWRRPTAAVVAVAALIALGLWRLAAAHSAGANLLSGYIEGEALYLAPPLSGPVTSVAVVRGQAVAQGAALFTVDARTAQAELQQANAAVAQARALALAADAGVKQQAANLSAARASLANSERDAARYDRVRVGGGVSEQDADRARTLAQSASDARAAAEAQVRNARALLASDQASLAHAAAAVAEARARLDQLSVRSPAPGRIEEVYFQTGEWVAANQPILSLIPDGKVKLRFFVPARTMALYRLGRSVRFSCDACKAGRTATIDYVSPAPEFTPPVIYSREARDRLVFLVEARPRDPAGLTPGLPADVVPLDSDRSGQ